SHDAGRDVAAELPSPTSARCVRRRRPRLDAPHPVRTPDRVERRAESVTLLDHPLDETDRRGAVDLDVVPDLDESGWMRGSRVEHAADRRDGLDLNADAVDR